MSLLLQFGSTAHDRVTNACSALQKGMGVILVDDEHRENEGDLIFSAQTVTVHQINQMIHLTPENATRLNLNPMVSTNTNRFETAFTVSIEAREGVTTGVSAYDRLKTIRTATISFHNLLTCVVPDISSH
jgi:3,4-dihydroxy 2-butanone 4-phosphate synthase